MTITRIDITRPPGPILSHCVVHNKTVYLAGIAARTFPSDIRAQTTEVLTLIDEYLARAGTDKTRIVTAQVWLKDMSLFQAMNEVWNDWVDVEAPPSRACVSGELSRSDALVEVMVTALKGDSSDGD